MTQLPLSTSLTDRVRAWAGERSTFADLCDAFPGESATDLDAAAVAAGVLHWADEVGFYVGREGP